MSTISQKPRRGRKRGRKPFAPRAFQRELVTLFVADGIAEADIAREIGICRDTLRKHFAEELHCGRAHQRALNLKLLAKAAKRGNVTAMKHLDATFRLAAAAASFEAPAPIQPKLGKKAAAQAEATNAGIGTDWGDDLKAPLN